MNSKFVIDFTKKLLLGLLAIGLLAVGALGWLMFHPDHAWRYLVRPSLIGENVNESWSQAHLKLSRTEGLSWQFEWTVSGYKLERVSPKLEFFADLKVVGTLRLLRGSFKIEVDQLDFVAPQPGFYTSDARANLSEMNPYEWVHSGRQGLKRINQFFSFKQVRIQITDIEQVANNQDSTHISISVLKPGVAEIEGFDIQVSLKNKDSDLQSRSSLRLDLVDTDSHFFKSHIEQKTPKNSTVADLELATSAERTVLTGNLSAQVGDSGRPIKIQSAVEGAVRADQVVIAGAGSIDNLPGGVSSVKDLTWAIDFPLLKGAIVDHLSGQMKVSAPLPLFFVTADVRTQLEKNCQCRWPDTLKVDLNGKIWPGHLLYESSNERSIVSLAVNVEPLMNRIIELKMNGELRVTKDPSGKFQLAPTIDGSLKLPNFQAVKAMLEANKIMVPSPFDVLEGSIEAKIKTTLWQSTKGLAIPIEVTTNLYTQVQKINTSAKITLYVPEDFKSMDVLTDITINDFVVELPPIDPVQGLPQLTQDSRVLTQPQKTPESQGFKVSLAYSLRTSKPGAVRLLSKLAKPAIPLSLVLDRTVKGNVLGTMKVEAFELTYLHRTMFVDLLRIIMDDRESADFAVDGRLRVEQTNYKVFIAISGTLQSPLIKLTSEPELSHSDIISVLLYDRTGDQLVTADRETVGTFDAAISDRAIGLLGLWIFASTPIRSFSYNPASKVYTATVQLAEGTTASIGTNWEQAAQLEVKKRITRRWVLTASWAPSDEKSQSGKLVLQWEKRF